MGNLRFYYVAPEEYEDYPDFAVYPHYPGFHLFVHVWTPAKRHYFRHVQWWHLHPDYPERFPYRVDYRHGYGRHDVHFSTHAKFGWHKKTVRSKQVTKPKSKGRHRH